MPAAAVAGMAALCNGTAAHGEDFDDTYEGGPAHAGAVIVPAILATAEKHGLSGGDVGLGIAVGCEVMCRLCHVAPKRVHQAGFHPTAVFGAIAAAAGVGASLRLDAAQLTDAMGIAASMSSGIIEYLAEGAWTKRMHPGWAAQSGYRAARLAQGGFVGPRTVFEGEHGFFHAFARSRTGRLRRDARRLRHALALRRHRLQGSTHAARWRIPTSTARASWSPPGSIPPTSRHIECDTAEGIVHRLWEPLAAKQNPPNGYAAKFSIPYAIAVGMLRDNAGLREYDESVVHDPRVRALAAKVGYRIDPDNPYPRRFTGHLRVDVAQRRSARNPPGSFPGRRRCAVDVRRARAEIPRQLRAGGLAAAETERVLEQLTQMLTAPKVDLRPLRRADSSLAP